LLHVAAARVMMCSAFASADDRQLAVAKATGLKVVDIKRRPRRRKSSRRGTFNSLGAIRKNLRQS